MSEFILSDEVDNQKCFILKRSEIEKRLDPFYYIPSIKELEKQILNQKARPLRYFIDNISSGETPKTSEKERYYSDKENGIPFLRVQNLSPTGLLKLDNCKYINKQTHNSNLKRSRVGDGDLLVKITGVGRMAVASVAPDDFIGNTNQHIAVIKTKDRETSEILASYLNTDIGEMLASRRATGGTRPALDYPSLLSIPIIFDKKILEVYELAIKSKKQKEQQAQELLDSINTYLLDELGITLPTINNTLETRIFKVKLSKVTSTRLDCDYYSYQYEVLKECISSVNRNLIKVDSIESIVTLIKNGKTPAKSEYSEDKTDYPIIKAGSYTDEYIDLEKVGYTRKSDNHKAEKGDIFILSSAHQSQYVGKQIKILNDDITTKISYVGELICIRANKDLCNPMYLFSLLNLDIYKTLLNREKRGQTSHIYDKDIKKIDIPLPSIEKQNQMANHIQTLRDKAQNLKIEANNILENAKQEVESMILDNGHE